MGKPRSVQKTDGNVVRKEIAISGSEIYSPIDFHKIVSSLLEFPSYYRNDIDDLYNCLTQYTDPNLTINWMNHAVSEKQLGYEFIRIVEVFQRVKDIHPSFEFFLN